MPTVTRSPLRSSALPTPCISSEANKPKVNPAPGTALILESSGWYTSACFSNSNSVEGRSLYASKCSVIIGVNWSWYDNVTSYTAGFNINSLLPTEISLTWYSPKYKGMDTASFSVSVTSVSASSPACRRTVPSGVTISVLARISYTHPAILWSWKIGRVMVPNSVSSVWIPANTGPFLLKEICPIAGWFGNLTSTTGWLSETSKNTGVWFKR